MTVEYEDAYNCDGDVWPGLQQPHVPGSRFGVKVLGCRVSRLAFRVLGESSRFGIEVVGVAEPLARGLSPETPARILTEPCSLCTSNVAKPDRLSTRKASG